MKRVGYGFVYLAIFGLLLSAGCTVKRVGKSHENTPPKVFFSTVPVAGTVFTRPDQFFWFALDRDGYITEFQYALVPDSVVRITFSPPEKEDSVVRAFLNAHPVDTDTLWHWRIVDNIFRNGQTDTIALPTSSRNPGDTATRNTVVFVRARDDRGVLSTASPNFPDSNSIAWRYFGRKNRPPKTHFQSIGTCNKSPVANPGLTPTFYSLDFNTYDTSGFMKVGHCGITISWFGSDSADYPNQEQPTFDYFWELFGPFTSTPNADTNRLWASTTYPVRWPGPGSGQSPTRQTFTSATSVTFFGLRGADTLTNFRPGLYHFRVRARDDAGVVAPLTIFAGSPGAATNNFRVVRPRFDRDILLVSKSTTTGGGSFLNNVPPYGLIPDGSTPPQESMLVQNYYLKLIRDAGYGARIDSALDVKFFSEKSDPNFLSTSPPMPLGESLLARYKLVIFHKEKVFPTANTNFLSMLKAYMDAGGSVWGMGRDDLSDLSLNFGVAQPVELFFERANPIQGAGYFNFGAEKMFYHAHALSVARDSISREEFVGADPSDDAISEGFPPLDIDTAVVSRYTVAASRKDTSRYRQMPGVNYFVRQPRSEFLYLFRSPVGVADTSHLHGKVVAFRADRTFFKTAYFGFPLYGIKESQAVQVVQKMLNWFIGPP